MDEPFDDPNFWAEGPPALNGPWKFIFESDGRVRIVAKAKDGRLFAWEKNGFVLYEDEFTAWVREVRENHDNKRS